MYLAEVALMGSSKITRDFEIMMESLLENQGFSQKDLLTRYLEWVQDDPTFLDENIKGALNNHPVEDPDYACIMPLTRMFPLIIYYGTEEPHMSELISVVCQTTHRQSKCIEGCQKWYQTLLLVLQETPFELELNEQDPFAEELSLIYRAFGISLERGDRTGYQEGLSYLLRHLRDPLRRWKNQLVLLYGQLAGTYWGVTGLDERDLFSLPKRKYLSNLIEQITSVSTEPSPH